MRFRLAGEDVIGGYSVGAMTDPELQGRGLFVRVGEHLYDRLEREGYAFVAGFSNQRSHNLMTSRLGRIPIRPFPWSIRLLRPLAALLAVARRGGTEASPPPPPVAASETPNGVIFSPCAPDDPRLDTLWKRSAASLRVGGVRDSAFAAWRFGSRPDADYRALLALRDGEPVAWAVHRDLTLRGLRARFVVDLLVAPGAEAAGRALLRHLESGARTAGCTLMSALLPGSGPTRDALRTARYRRVPERLHPQVIRFSARGFGRFAGCPELGDPAAWHLGWSDTDVV